MWVVATEHFTQAEIKRLNAVGFIVPGLRTKKDMMIEVVHYEARKRGEITQKQLVERLAATSPHSE